MSANGNEDLSKAMGIMPLFRITVINETFSATDEYELASDSEAQAEAIKSALAIGSDEINGGKGFFGAEVKVERCDELLARFVVSVGASRIEPNR